MHWNNTIMVTQEWVELLEEKIVGMKTEIQDRGQTAHPQTHTHAHTKLQSYQS